MKSRIILLVLLPLLLTIDARTTRAQSVEYLIVGGGGGGGLDGGGGGGGGGVVMGAFATMGSGTYPVAVGAGGPGRSGSVGSGAGGGNSSINGVVALGGGGGGGSAGGAGAGACGGGGSWYPSAPGGSGTQGYSGGSGLQMFNGAGGGGGGAGGAGANAWQNVGGNGGAGVSSSISGTAAIYGSGGGGSGDPTNGTGGSGAGSGGNQCASGGDAGPNAGAGGGGTHYACGGARGGNGGSGIVIVRYPIGSITATGGAITTAGGYRIHTFTTSGTFVISSVPTLTSIAPNSGNQGANVTVTLTGTNFAAGATVAVSGADVTVSSVSVTNSTSLTANFAIAWTTATGARNVTVTTSGGTTNSQSFTVGAQPSPAGWLLKKDAAGNSVPSGAYEINGNIGVGTQAPAKKLHIAGDLQVDGNIAARYQDVAEWVDAADVFAPGTVVVVDRSANRVASTDAAYDTAVIGVVSASPGVMLGEAGPGRILVAQSGRVRTKVDARFGAIHRGDLLVTSPNPGYAMRSAPFAIGGIAVHRPGTLIGKALEELKDGTGEILVLLTLQ